MSRLFPLPNDAAAAAAGSAFATPTRGPIRGFHRGVVVLLMTLCLSHVTTAQPTVERVTSKIPFPRGLAMVDLDEDGVDELYVLSRGRVRGSGGADAKVDDQAGTIWRVDPATGEASVFARPTEPPFKLLDRTLDRPRDDRQTDRPYCTLRWHEATRSFYLCAFSGVDLPADDPVAAETGSFSKNYTDAVLGYSVDRGEWFEVDRHDPQFGADYPGADGRGWAKGPDNLVAVDDTLIVAAKDNSRLVAYDVHQPATSPEIVLGDTVRLANRDGEQRTMSGHSALAVTVSSDSFEFGQHSQAPMFGTQVLRGSWLYVAFRTSGEVIRVPLDRHFSATPVNGMARTMVRLRPDEAELLAEFQPWVPETGESANITDLSIGPDGDVYVVSAMPARIYRFTPDPQNVRDFVSAGQPWADLAALTGNRRMKSENVLVTEDGVVYVTSGDAYADDQGPGLGGTVWRVTE